MAASTKKTSEVFTAARKGLQAQLELVRKEIGRLAGEEHALTQALSNLSGDGARSSSRASATKAGARAPRGKSSAKRSSTRKSPKGRPRRGAKSTADRLEQVRGLLAEGPKSMNTLAAALKVSAPRVQQLLAELGSQVSSRPDPERPQAKLWSLKGSGNTASKPTPKRSGAKAKRAPSRKASARRKPAAK